MPKGLASIESAREDIEARKAAGAAGGSLYFKLQDGESAIVRFLEQGDELSWAWVHELTPEKGKSYGQKVPCRDQGDDGERIGAACPGCDDDLSRTFRGVVNIIWRDAPVYERDDNDRLVKDSKNQLNVVGQETQLALWQAGITVFSALMKKDAKFKGLKSRDFEITRQGSGLNTTYSIEPADADAGPQEMSNADLELAAEKPDLTAFITPPAYDDWGKQRRKAQQQEASTESVSPFRRRTADNAA